MIDEAEEDQLFDVRLRMAKQAVHATTSSLNKGKDCPRYEFRYSYQPPSQKGEHRASSRKEVSRNQG